MCGKEGNFDDYKLEGAVLSLCNNCNKGAKYIPRKKTQVTQSGLKKQYDHSYERSDEEQIRVVVDDFARLIKNKRNSLNLTIEKFASLINEKSTLMNKLESGKLVPSLKIAEKLERALNMKLIKFETVSGESMYTSADEDTEMTIGDLFKNGS